MGRRRVANGWHRGHSGDGSARNQPDQRPSWETLCKRVPPLGSLGAARGSSAGPAHRLLRRSNKRGAGNAIAVCFTAARIVGKKLIPASCSAWATLITR